MIQRHRVVEFLDPLTRAFSHAGQPLYLVGGIVRGLELGIYSDSDDLDLTTPARPDEIRTIIADEVSSVWAQGERFGTIGARFHGRPVEITTHRAETYNQESRKPEVAFGDDLETDLSRRDFTINAMAIALPDGELVDPFGGRQDLAGRRLRTPLDPKISFGDDPLRILRAARFITRFGLTPDAELLTAATTMSSRLEIVSVERVQVEIELLLALPAPRAGLEFLDNIGVTEFIFGPLNSVSAHEAAATPNIGATLRRCALLGHGGSDKTRQWMSEHRYSADDTRTTTAIVAGAHALADVEATDASVRRFVLDVGLDRVADAFALAELRPEIYGDPSELRTAFDSLNASENLGDLASPLSGAEIMKVLKVGESRLVGEAMEFLQNQRLQLGPLATTDAIALLNTWWADQSSSRDHRPQAECE